MKVSLFFSPVEKFDIINFYYFKLNDYLDFSLTNISIYFFFSFLLICVFFYRFFFFDFNIISIEIILKFLYNILDKQVLNKKGNIFFPLIICLFTYVLVLNIYGVVPFNFSVTSHLILTFFFSIIVWINSILIGIYENGYNFYKLFVPNVPIYLLPFLIFIEIMSYIMRVFSLAIRLSANITSGHVLLFTIANFIVKTINLSLIVGFLLIFVLFFVFVLELGVSVLQAYVFVVLSCIYFNDSLNLSH